MRVTSMGRVRFRVVRRTMNVLKGWEETVSDGMGAAKVWGTKVTEEGRPRKRGRGRQPVE